MVGHDFKKPGLIRAGFEYQDLVAIEVLIDFYRDQNRYAWVQLDSDDPSFASIDDVVACHPDGMLDLIQVKFAADPSSPASSLSWDWLLRKRGAGTSLLEKWARTTARHLTTGLLRTATLKTDRMPDAQFSDALGPERVDWVRVSPEIQSRIIAQLGSTEAAEAFFQVFNFKHSQSHIDELEHRLWARVSSDADLGGWHLFKAQVARWAGRKNQPHPDGKIRHNHLRQVFSTERPRPIPQNFHLPSGYRPPSSVFDSEFRKTAFANDGVSVLWAPPGRGKSTYLSYCVAKAPKGAVCIRHHYFLGFDDRSEGRFQFAAIAHSLRAQLPEMDDERSSERRGYLKDQISKAAGLLQANGQRLVIVIDGLDHVWRENRSREDMEELFDHLLPLPPNVSLVVGTQKIDEANLPQRLMRARKREDWIELPLMSPGAVGAWLDEQDKAGRIVLARATPELRERELRGISSALYEISQGLPLHLIYSFEGLVRAGAPFDETDVRTLPSCPSGDIRDYYRGFWTRAGAMARVVLHVLAGLEFGPPPKALPFCFERSADVMTALSDIGHLLDLRETGVRPFHGSLFAFVREMSEHQAIFETHAQGVLTWLRSDEAGYWQWAWLWITERQLGDSSQLLDGVGRPWALAALEAGYPIDQVVNIFRHAEQAAFEAFDLPRLLRFRAIKTRCLNAPDFQTQDWSRIVELGLTLSSDPTPYALRRSNLTNTPDELLPFVVRTADGTIQSRLLEETIAELNRRITWARTDMEARSDRQRRLAVAVAGVVACGPVENAARLLAFARRRDDTGLVTEFARAARLAGQHSSVLAVAKKVTSRELAREVLASLSADGLKPSSVPELKGQSAPALRVLELVLGGHPTKCRVRRDAGFLFPDLSGDRSFYEGTADALYDLFFSAFAVALQGREPAELFKLSNDQEDTWLGEVVRLLEDTASFAAQIWKSEQRLISLIELYSCLDLGIPDTPHHNDRRRLIAVRLALRDIGTDLSLMQQAISPTQRISKSEVEEAETCGLWNDEIWLDDAARRRLPIFHQEAVELLVGRASADLLGRATETNERTDSFAQLSMVAADYGLTDAARTNLRSALDCALSYGWRKDMFAQEVLDSLEAVADAGSAIAHTRILSLACAFEALTDLTDGSETNHIRSTYYEVIAKRFPEKVSSCFASLVTQESYRYAEDLTCAFAARADLETPRGQALLETYLVPRETFALEEAATAGRPFAEAALLTVKRRTGRTRPPRQRYSSDSGLTEGDPADLPDPHRFAPDNLPAFLEALEKVPGFDIKKGCVADWILVWEEKGEGEAALTAFEAAAAKRNGSYRVDEALDEAFEVAVRVRGRRPALAFLVQAHVINYGWQRWFTSEERTLKRLRRFAELYRDEWQEFIRTTFTTPNRISSRDNELVVGFSRLVTFLLYVNQTDQAERVALELAAILEDELAGQPIPSCTWAA